MDKICEELYKIGIVPVIAIDDAKDAEPLAQALINGGLPAAEVTFRTAAAEEAIRIISEKFPEMIVGAGTVLNKEQADRAKAAGAKFIVSPGFNRSNVEYIQSIGVPVVPGTATPGEVEQAIELGLDCVKFFPAEQNGGIAKIKAMAAPYTKMHFMPTGGVNKNNLNDYLGFNKVFCCGGSWMVKKDLISAGKFDEIEAMTRDAVNAMLGFTMKHVGINETDAAAAEKTAEMFDLFGFGKKVGNSSVFAGSVVEVMKSQGRGTHGHIAIGTNNVDRAVYHLGKQGVKFDETSFSYDADNHLKVAYLADEFGGFAVHLVKN
ncbi:MULTISPECIES: bifunctional 4-hydroxy-2-oxoglutarate aldolase/2-dehydro-3-deoxy-phosphogluconate aldolase [unclassified Butyrivibrio]|uniref:bifunctional 4-hydroxy-2-oxoglutarate aldolase/2-dehydro-3-deoxy-phosphogluconate aldolase n=1 Tax=unclassified Butyrivibrio TaxID=2639466 RepID=UPI00041CD0FF|nr:MULTISPECIES: bifunctional 4-hydroxy-2-oxoglutarate aldolase/2-dehydro-3-deoxy-phosphogluconate aldolase [unclassified Butyrivibrio]SCY54537.1 2-dehydro-3-deoxyphosphogluconate aldolase / (4S)-4-hydroxy-2-oxoglutarate aldolase [Butyrivibrio sp. INlla14]